MRDAAWTTLWVVLQRCLPVWPGIVVFDQEELEHGLERLLRDAAMAHGLHLYVRRGLLLTNFNYVLSLAPLEDDVSSDPFA